MFIQQTRRAYYDPNGSLSKIDIIRTIRRPNVPPTYIPQLQNSNYHTINSHSSSNSINTNDNPYYNNNHHQNIPKITYYKDNSKQGFLQIIRIIIFSIVIVSSILLIYCISQRIFNNYNQITHKNQTIQTNNTIQNTTQQNNFTYLENNPQFNLLQTSKTQQIFQNQSISQIQPIQTSQTSKVTSQQLEQSQKKQKIFQNDCSYNQQVLTNSNQSNKIQINEIKQITDQPVLSLEILKQIYRRKTKEGFDYTFQDFQRQYKMTPDIRNQIKKIINKPI